MKIKWVISTLLIMLLMALSSSFISAGNIWRVSISSTGEQGNDGSVLSTISADGRFIAFHSAADNLVPGGKKVDVFVHDMWTGITERLSISPSGEEGNDWESGVFPSINADGRYVAFSSCASNLVPNDTNNKCDIFVRDRLTGQTERVSISSTGIQGDNHSHSQPAISADGRYVAFSSYATNLVTNDTNNVEDVFVRDRLLGLTRRVSVSSSGGEANSWSYSPSISSDGRYVAFTSYASNLVPGDTNNANDIFIHDLLTGTTERVSVSSTGEESYGCSFASPGNFSPSISANGRYVAFTSACIGLVPGYTKDPFQIYVHDRTTRMTERVSLSSNGEKGNNHSSQSSISGDGRYVVFDSYASNLVPGDTNGEPDVFVHDRLSKKTTRISISWNGEQGNNYIGTPSISADGRYVTFSSNATNLVTNDTNGVMDVFVVKWQKHPISLPKTGQTKCYDTYGTEIACAGTGQDGELRVGAEWPEPRFTVSGDCVTDNLTGLMWAKDANLPNGTRSWQGALDFVASINAGAGLCGYKDWRLPNIIELESLVNAGKFNIATWLNEQGFINVHSAFYFYWSSTTYAYDNSYAWVVYMWDGRVLGQSKLGGNYVWPVRSGQINNPQPEYPPNVWKSGQITSYANRDDGELKIGVAWPTPRFTDHGNGTITDNLTGLMWPKNANLFNGAKAWQEALDYVKLLNSGAGLGGYHDWRLPNRKELFSLIDFSRYDPALPGGHPFQNVQFDRYWSSTTYRGSSRAWPVSMRSGGMIDNVKSNTYYVWPVRTATIGFEDPDIHITPRTLDFGNITIGRSSEKVVTVLNTGNANLIIGTITSPSPPFYKINDNCSGQVLTSGSQCTVSYRFSPSSVGSFSSSSNIPSTDPNEPLVTINLSGRSVSIEHLVLIVVDGLRKDVLKYVLDSEHENAPNLKYLFKNLPHIWFDNVETTFPSVTIPANASLVTGLYPDRHGIPGNVWFDRYRDEHRYYTDLDIYTIEGDPLRVYTEELATRDLRDEVRTIYDYLLDNQHSSRIHFHMFGSKTYDNSFFWHKPTWYDMNLYARLKEYEKYDHNMMFDVAKQIKEGGLPNLLTLYFAGNDGNSHKNGPIDQVRYLVNVIDPLIGKLIKGTSVYGKLKRFMGNSIEELDFDGLMYMHKDGVPLLDKTIFIIVSDHGQFPVLGEANTKDLPFSFLAKNGGMAQIYVRQGINDWGDYPFLRGDISVIADYYWRRRIESNIDFILVRDSRGSNNWSSDYKQYKGLNNAGNVITESLNFGHMADERVKRLDFDRSGDIILIAKPGYSFGKQDGGDHGSIFSADSTIPLIFSGKPLGVFKKIIDEPKRIIDIAPTITKLFGITMNNVDGEELDEVICTISRAGSSIDLPCISITPKRLDFGNLVVGCNNEREIIVSNIVNANLKVGTIHPPELPFYKIPDFRQFI